MKKSKRDKLHSHGYKITGVQEFLQLSEEEISLIDLKIQLISKLRAVRSKLKLTQKDLAKLMKTSQSRIALLEGGSSDVSLDLVCKALFTLGVSTKTIGNTIAMKRAA